MPPAGKERCSTRQRELVDLLLHKAEQDETAMVRLLSDAGIDDEMIGFLAQQAVEKALKAWLAHLGIDFPRVHSLGALMDLLGVHGSTLPTDLAAADKLTPFATVFRYDDLPISSTFDRMDALRLAQGVRKYVIKIIDESR